MKSLCRYFLGSVLCFVIMLVNIWADTAAPPAKIYVGDSYYNWSINIPDDARVYSVNFDCTEVDFLGPDSSYFVYLEISDLFPDENIETLLADHLDAKKMDDHEIISVDKMSTEGIPYYKILSEASLYNIEERLYVKDNKSYLISLEVIDATGKWKDTNVRNLLDSFNLTFKKDGKVKDLSNITADGKRAYTDKELKFSINIPKDWEFSKQEGTILFSEILEESAQCGDELLMKLNSLENGLTLDKWAEIELNKFKGSYNPKLVKLIKSEDITLNNITYKKILSSRKLGNQLMYNHDYYVIGKNYRYKLSYITKKSYNNPIIADSINRLIGSFSFSEPNPGELFEFDEDYKLIESGKIRNVKSDLNRFSVEIPEDWFISIGELGYLDHYVFMNGEIALIILTSKEKSFEELMKQRESELADFHKVNISFSKVSLTAKDTEVIKYEIIEPYEDILQINEYYFLTKNGICFEFRFLMSELYASDKNKKRISDIWKSVTFE